MDSRKADRQRETKKLIWKGRGEKEDETGNGTKVQPCIILRDISPVR